MSGERLEPGAPRSRDGERWLLVTAPPLRVAIPITRVEETMRPLPTASFAGAPAWLRGVSTIRGEACPVIALDHLLTGKAGADPTRFVTLSDHGRRVALAVAAVVGVASLPEAGRGSELARAFTPEHLTELRAADGGLVGVLSEVRLVDDETWALLETEDV